MKRRTFLVAATLPVTGCLTGDGPSDDRNPGGTTAEPTTTTGPTGDGTTDKCTTGGDTGDVTTGKCTTGTSGEGTPGGGGPGDPGDDSADGYPPPFSTTPAQQSVDPSSFGRVVQDGVEVPLAPIEVAHYWYRRREARFADARGRDQYERSHVRGAVWSPAPDGGEDDPVEDWPAGDRIVAYCGCPHHLSSIRAADLIAAGYERVYVIDEGFWEWHDRGYPMAGSDVSVRPAVREVRGRTDPRYAGRTAWAFHDPTGQREAAPIDARGRYRLELSFAGVSPASVVRVRTPEYTVRAPLETLTAGTVTGPQG